MAASGVVLNSAHASTATTVSGSLTQGADVDNGFARSRFVSKLYKQNVANMDTSERSPWSKLLFPGNALCLRVCGAM